VRVIRVLSVTCLVCALSASAVATAGCTSMHRVSVGTTATQPASKRFGPGDTVRITMNDGRRIRFTVQTVDATAITGKGTRYDLADIRTIERREFSGTKTTVLVVGILAGWFFLAYAAAVAQLATFGL
jgi:endonuclease YncB( thermonuclease family)